jgi:hypothetical protein
MSIVLMGSTSGSITLSEPAVAGSNTISLPAATGTAVITSTAVSAAGQIPFSTDGTSYTPTAKIVSGTAVASTSGTSIDFTSIPSWVKRVTVMFNGVSLSGTASPLIQLGDSGGIENTGYISSSAVAVDAASSVVSNNTTGFVIRSATATNVNSGHIIFTNVSGNIWISSHSMKQSTTACMFGGGDKTLSDILTQIRITTTNGTDTFDAGSINILYE